MKRKTKTYPAVKLSSSWLNQEFVLKNECDVSLFLEEPLFLELLIMLDMAYDMARGANDSKTADKISQMVDKLIYQYNHTQGIEDYFDWRNKCRWGNKQ